MAAEEKPTREKSLARKIGLLLGPTLFFGIRLLPGLAPENPSATRMAAVAALMAVWWITDAIPLYATALLQWCSTRFWKISPAEKRPPFTSTAPSSGSSVAS